MPLSFEAMFQIFQLKLLPNLIFIIIFLHQFSYGEDKLMIIGGFNDGHPTNAVNTFDLASRSVHKFAPLNKNRYSHSCIAAVMAGKEYVFAAGTHDHLSNVHCL